MSIGRSAYLFLRLVTDDNFFLGGTHRTPNQHLRCQFNSGIDKTQAFHILFLRGPLPFHPNNPE